MQNHPIMSEGVELRGVSIGMRNEGFGHHEAMVDREKMNSPTEAPHPTEVTLNGTTAEYPGRKDPEQTPHNCFIGIVIACQTAAHNAWEKNKDRSWKAFYFLLALGFAVYFGLAMRYEFGSEPSVRLLWVTCLVGFCSLIWVVSRCFGSRISQSCRCWMDFMELHSGAVSWLLVAVVYLSVIVFVIVDVAHLTKNAYNLVSATGIIVYVLLFFIFSYSPVHVNWRAVAWGLGLQFLLGMLVLRWDAGYRAFEWLGDRVTEFIDHSNAGAEFVFGENYTDHFFAFRVSSVIIFFSTTVVILFYLGWMQVVIKKVAYVMAYTMGTTAAESLSAAANVFVGMTEGPLVIRPFLERMTRSEIHAVMTGGFATVSGSGIGAYALMGVPANHLISASVMSAPAALAMSKLSCPETEVSKTTIKDLASHKEVPKERNIIEAAASGASGAIKVVASIMANLIAFISMLHFLNSTLTWFGNRVGIEELTLELICSYVLFPFAMVMGVELDDCRKVAKMIGIKTFLNEFVAYRELGELINNKLALVEHVASNGTWYYEGDDIILVDTNVTLFDGVLSERSEVISTYALCGFANFGSIGIMIGSLGSMAPNQKVTLSEVALRAMIAGNVACFMTACVAGVLYQG